MSGLTFYLLSSSGKQLHVSGARHVGRGPLHLGIHVGPTDPRSHRDLVQAQPIYFFHQKEGRWA